MLSSFRITILTSTSHKFFISLALAIECSIKALTPTAGAVDISALESSTSPTYCNNSGGGDLKVKSLLQAAGGATSTMGEVISSGETISYGIITANLVDASRYTASGAMCTTGNVISAGDMISYGIITANLVDTSRYKTYTTAGGATCATGALINEVVQNEQAPHVVAQNSDSDLLDFEIRSSDGFEAGVQVGAVSDGNY